MKRYILAVMVILAIACNQKKRLDDSNAESASPEISDEFNAFINFDSIPSDIGTAERKKLDSLFLKGQQEKKPDSIVINKEKFFILEGDLLLNDYEYMQFKIAKLQEKGKKENEAKLVGMQTGDSIVKWPAGYVIKYCITRSSFRTAEQYAVVKANLKQATLDWEKTCKVKFYHDEAKDSKNLLTATPDLTFVVLGFDSRNRFIASAFFPNDDVAKRRMLIDPGYFTTLFDKTGVLRHELGHVLGFWHEHTRKEAPLVCRREDTAGRISRTRYDPKSVMHYFCGGMGTMELVITKIDRDGSQSIYGAP